MRYPNKLYLEFLKTPLNKRGGLSKGQITIMKNFKITKVNISRKMNDYRSGINYQMTQFKDYPDMLEIEFTRLDQLDVKK